MDVINKKKIAVLNIRDFNKGGVEEYLCNIYKYIGNDYDITIIVPGKIISYDNMKRLVECGVKFYELNTVNVKLLKYIHFYIKINLYLKKNSFDAVHIHTGNIIFQALTLFVAKNNNIRNRFSHSHSSVKTEKFYYPILRKIINNYATCKIACSDKAAISLFGSIDNVIFAKNGIELEKYKYDVNIRTKYRRKYGIEKEIVFGCVANFQAVKNHKLLIKIFYEYQKKQNNLKLILVGDGELKNEIVELIRLYKIEKKVIFTGCINNVNEIIQMFDVMLLCSYYEGLPISLIEAQACGIPCVISDVITTEVGLNNNVYFVNIDDKIEQWLEKIEIALKIQINRFDQTNLVKNGYNIQDAVKIILYIYSFY